MKHNSTARILLALVALAVIAVAGLYGFLPAPIDPVVFEPAPQPPDFEVNTDLKRLEVLDLADRVGPEDVAVGPDGAIYAATLKGDILKMSADRESLAVFVNTGGRPLGLAFDRVGRLIVADPYRGLLRYGTDGGEEVLVPAREQAAAAGPQPVAARASGDGRSAGSSSVDLCYANNVDVAPDGTIYFTDSSARFCPPAYGGTFEASLLDIFEHRKTGRFLSYDPRTGVTRVLVDGIQFANGVALAPDGAFALVVETGDYRVLKYHLRGARRGAVETIVDGMAGFPDNLTRGLDGRYWIGFTKPRSKILEKLAGRPLLRGLIARLPRSLFPVPPPYGHVVAIDGDGRVLVRHQDPEPEYPDTTGVTETATGLYVHSLHARGLGWLPRRRTESK